MTVHSIQNYCNASLMRFIDESLQILPFTKSLIHTKVANGQKAPIHRVGDVGDRHQLDAVNPQVSQIIQLGDCTIDIATELVYHQFVQDNIVQCRGLPEILVITPCIIFVSQGEG